MKLKVTLAAVAALLLFAGTAQASYYVPASHTACKAGYKRESLLVAERHRVRVHGRTVWWRVRRHGQVVHRRQVRCVYVTPKTTAPNPGPTPTATAPTPSAPAPGAVHAGIDPAYTQDAADNLKVTWTYSASGQGNPLPAGTLSLQVSQPGSVGSSGGCEINVGGAVTGGTCTQELPSYGAWNVTVSYTGASSTVAPATSTDTETIEPLPLTVAKTWGTDSPTAGPTVNATVIGTTANVTVSDGSYEGATSLPVSDNLGDSCTATISGTTASCSMLVTGTPSRFSLAYPGGTSTQSTQPVPPGGTQNVTTTWPSVNVPVNNPSVTVQQATVTECGGSQQGGPWSSLGGCSYGSPNPWPNPLSANINQNVNLYAITFGSLANDRTPIHGDGQVAGYLTFTVTAPSGAVYSATDNQSGPNNSATDCSEVTTQGYLGGDPSNPANYGPNEPTGTCTFNFQTNGTYTIRVGYVSQDANYASVPNAVSETVNVP